MKILITLLLLPFSVSAESLFSSGVQQVPLIELYSSEGCSSCPPADRWVASLKKQPRLWRDFVPLNFHVDYWNQLGWVDRFSNKRFTQRQRNYASSWGSGRIYTPGFVKDGKEWRGSKRVPKKAKKQVGNLAVERLKGNLIRVTYTPTKTPKGPLQMNYSLLGMGLSTKVKFGENAGETLSHEFVVLTLSREAFRKSGKAYVAEFELANKPKAKAKSYSVAVWVSEKGKQSPIQSTGGSFQFL